MCFFGDEMFVCVLNNLLLIMSLLIKNGEIVIVLECYVVDIFCEGEIIMKIGCGFDVLVGMEVIDVIGRFVFFGFIDLYVYIYLLFMGMYLKDIYVMGS